MAVAEDAVRGPQGPTARCRGGEPMGGERARGKVTSPRLGEGTRTQQGWGVASTYLTLVLVQMTYSISSE